MRKDGQTEFCLTEDGTEVFRTWLGEGGQFAILDANTRVPIIEGWAERVDHVYARWLLIPRLEPRKRQLEMAYTEIYSPDPALAASQEPVTVELRGKPARTVYFVGYLEGSRPENATKAIASSPFPCGPRLPPAVSSTMRKSAGTIRRSR